MRTSLQAVSLFAAVVLLGGCAANPYTQFYRGQPDGRALENYVPPAGSLEIYSTNNFDRDTEALEKRGFTPIGGSNFNAAANSASERQLREQADKLGAAAVLVSSRYTHTVSGAMPLVLPNTSTSMTTGNATVTGTGGVANVNGSATTTTYGTQTVMMPYSIQRSDFSAVYFVKRRVRVGAFFGAIDPATRDRLQTNAGLLVKVLIDGSPAARADILPGDIILSIDGERVDSAEGFRAQTRERIGREVVLGIDRSGTRLEKRLTPLQ